jgi:hypothetical protein
MLSQRALKTGGMSDARTWIAVMQLFNRDLKRKSNLALGRPYDIQTVQFGRLLPTHGSFLLCCSWMARPSFCTSASERVYAGTKTPSGQKGSRFPVQEKQQLRNTADVGPSIFISLCYFHRLRNVDHLQAISRTETLHDFVHVALYRKFRNIQMRCNLLIR